MAVLRDNLNTCLGSVASFVEHTSSHVVAVLVL